MERVEEEHLRMHWDCSAWCEVQRNGREVHPSLRAAAQRGVPIWRVRKREKRSFRRRVSTQERDVGLEGMWIEEGDADQRVGCSSRRRMLKQWGGHGGMLIPE